MKTTRRILSLALALALSLALACPAFAKELQIDNASMFRLTDSAITVTSEKISPSNHYTNLVDVGPAQTYICTAPVTVTRGSSPEMTDFYVCTLTRDEAALTPYEYDERLTVKENSVTITEPGRYFVCGSFQSFPVRNTVVLDVTEGTNETETVTPPPAETAPAALKSFSDVAQSHWAHDAIMEMVELGMFTGTKEPDKSGVGAFDPKGTMSRAQFITVVTRYLYGEELSAMSAGKTWYSNNYDVAIKNALISETEFPLSALEGEITREEMALLAVRTAESQGEELAAADKSAIADHDTIGEFYQPYVRQAFAAGLLTGYDEQGSFGPKDTLTREQGAMVAYRLVNKDARVK